MQAAVHSILHTDVARASGWLFVQAKIPNDIWVVKLSQDSGLCRKFFFLYVASQLLQSHISASPGAAVDIAKVACAYLLVYLHASQQGWVNNGNILQLDRSSRPTQ